MPATFATGTAYVIDGAFDDRSKCGDLGGHRRGSEIDRSDIHTLFVEDLQLFQIEPIRSCVGDADGLDTAQARRLSGAEKNGSDLMIPAR